MQNENIVTLGEENQTVHLSDATLDSIINAIKEEVEQMELLKVNMQEIFQDWNIDRQKRLEDQENTNFDADSTSDTTLNLISNYISEWKIHNETYNTQLNEIVTHLQKIEQDLNKLKQEKNEFMENGATKQDIKRLYQELIRHNQQLENDRELQDYLKGENEHTRNVYQHMRDDLAEIKVQLTFVLLLFLSLSLLRLKWCILVVGLLIICFVFAFSQCLDYL